MSSSTRFAREMFTQDYFDHAHDYFADWREDEPVHRATLPLGLPIWVVTRYEDVRAALTDERFAKDSDRIGELMRAKLAAMGSPTELPSVYSANMLMSDPPDHTRLRSLLARDFTSRRIEQLEPAIRSITDGLLDGLSARPAGPVDLIAGFALPLPSVVISELLGVPDRDRELFQRWSSEIMEGRPETLMPASHALDDYLVGLIRAKTEEPGDDLLSALTKASADGDRLSERELLSTAVLLLIAGHETTGNLIGNALHRLLTDRALADRLRANPGDLPPVIEELVRIDSPVMLATRRFTTAPVRIGDVTIPAGEIVSLSVGSANRDRRRFDRPEDLDTERGSRGHLGFGHGVHYCLGAPLARLESRIAIGSFLHRFPDATLAAPDEDLRHRHGTIVNGYAALPAFLSR